MHDLGVTVFAILSQRRLFTQRMKIRLADGSPYFVLSVVDGLPNELCSMEDPNYVVLFDYIEHGASVDILDDMTGGYLFSLVESGWSVASGVDGIRWNFEAWCWRRGCQKVIFAGKSLGEVAAYVLIDELTFDTQNITDAVGEV